jgi:hypothetical protein
MLQKNVYLLYPPGYSGSYINWAINISDADQKSITVDNPINTVTSDRLGGAGTSHLHTRIPTHQGLDRHLTWVLYNKPTDKRVYIINAARDQISECISMISMYDPTGIFVNIHNDNNSEIGAYSVINCVTKWPTFIDIRLLYKNLDRKSVHESFNPFDCANDRLFRNWAVKNNRTFFKHNHKLSLEVLNKELEKHAQWYVIRNRVQPHEVNPETYIDQVDLTGRIFEVSCVDICKDSFLDWFEQFMNASQISSKYNTDQVRQIHPAYCEAQPNLQWFDSIIKWQQTGQIDSYLTSHSIIEAQLLTYMFQEQEAGLLNNHQWQDFYNQFRGPDWPDADTESDFFNLPEWVQKEILDFGYQLAMTSPSRLANWENLSVTDINDLYQQIK